jgi:hypothetical protein
MRSDFFSLKKVSNEQIMQKTQLTVPLKINKKMTKVTLEGSWSGYALNPLYKKFVLKSPYVLRETDYFLRDHEDLMMAENFPELVPQGMEEPEDGAFVVGFIVEGNEVDELSEEEEE